MAYPNADAVSPGQRILHYQVEQRLGAGGMGIVYKALDTKLNRHVALKFLPVSLGSDVGYRERLLREAMAASAIDHPNMGAVHAIEELVDGRRFIVMSYYEGETLKDRLQRGRVPVAQAIDISIQAARGLAKAHERGIIHRDIKPSNLILTPDGVVKIVDFGLARISGTDNLTKTGTTIGTAAYMSPEQAAHSDMDHRTDLWSLGVVLHEMLEGDVPFHGESAPGVLYAVVHRAPDVLTGVPPALAAIVSRCLNKPLPERYPTARALIDDLERLRSGVPPDAATETISMARPQASKLRVSVRIAVVAIVLLAAIGLLWRELSSTRPAPQKVASATPPVAAPSPAASETMAPGSTPPAAAPPPPASAKLPPLRRALTAAEYGGPLNGELQWAGTLANDDTLTIQAGHAGSGTLSDDLPLAPVTVEIATPGIRVVEAPSARNQWDRLAVRNDSGSTVNRIIVRWKIVR